MLFLSRIGLVLFVLVFGLWWLCVTDLLRLWRWGGVRWANNVQNALGISNTLLMLRCQLFLGTSNMLLMLRGHTTVSWNFQHSLDATPSTFLLELPTRSWCYAVNFHGPSLPFQARHAILGSQPLSEKNMGRFGRDSGMIRSLHLEPLFAQYFQEGFWVWRCLRMVMMDLTGHTCDWCHDIRRWFEFKAPFTSFHVVQRRRTSGPVRTYIYIYNIIYIYNHIYIYIYIYIIDILILFIFCTIYIYIYRLYTYIYIYCIQGGSVPPPGMTVTTRQPVDWWMRLGWSWWPPITKSYP